MSIKMKIARLSSTELKRKTAEVLNLVAFGEMVAIIERYGEPLVQITAIKPTAEKDLREKLQKYFGSMPDFPPVSKKRFFRQRGFAL